MCFGKYVVVNKQIKECYDKGVNTLRLVNYNHMQTMGIFNKLQFRETYGKQKEYF